MEPSLVIQSIYMGEELMCRYVICLFALLLSYYITFS
jgi:hypothetical protein